MKPQEPETKFAVLMSEGCHRPTRHEFVKMQEAEGGESWEYLFACSETGVVRRWGLVRSPETEIN